MLQLASQLKVLVKPLHTYTSQLKDIDWDSDSITAQETK
jgi:hypothetical protein